MTARRSFAPLRWVIAALLLSSIALASCSPTPSPAPSPTPTDTPTPTSTPMPPTDTPAPPGVEVKCTPNVREVDAEVGQEVACFVETEDQDVQFVWSAIKGTLSPSEGGSAVIYAPDTEGVEIITLEASRDGSTTVEHISFNVVVRPTDTPAPTPTPALPDAVIVVDNVNVRSGPGTVYPVIGALNEGQALTVTGRSDHAIPWLQITTDQMREGWVVSREDLVTLNLSPEDIPIVPPPPTPTPSPLPPSAFTGPVCQIKSGQDKNTIFVRQAEFDALGLPEGTRVTVTVLDTGGTVENATLGLDSGMATCAVRLPGSFRAALGVAGDTDIELENRPHRSFLVLQSSPTGRDTYDFQGKVCQIKSGQDTNTVFLRQPEYNAFGVPVGTAVNLAVLDTGETVENVTLGLDSGMATCAVRLPRSFRVALRVAGDTDLDLDKRPIRHFRISKP